MIKTLAKFLLKRAVLIVALIAAIVTCFFVRIDSSYLAYFDVRTLCCLFCTLAVVCAFKNIKIFEIISRKIVTRFVTARSAITALVFITYFASMILANDMALITFLPLSYYVLTYANKRKYLAVAFVLQNVAANLGGMLTPFGNPQNLYLFSFFNISTTNFFAIMALPFAVALGLIIICCAFIKKEPLSIIVSTKYTAKPWRVAVYCVLFILSVLIVFRVFHPLIGTAVIVAALIVLDYKALLKVDYALLLTFCAFFVFSGNLSRIPAVINALSYLMSLNPLIVAVLSCQIISNVPSAVLLSRFTTVVPALLIGVNIGGLGTPIASLASLITLSEYRKAIKEADTEHTDDAVHAGNNPESIRLSYATAATAAYKRDLTFATPDADCPTENLSVQTEITAQNTPTESTASNVKIKKTRPTLKYLGLFSAINFAFLVVLVIVSVLILPLLLTI